VKVLREQVSGLETAMLSLVSPETTPDVSKGDRACAVPDITPDSKIYFVRSHSTMHYTIQEIANE